MRPELWRGKAMPWRGIVVRAAGGLVRGALRRVARRGVARLSGREAPVMEDNETELSQLLERIDRSIGFMESITPAELDGAEEREIRLPIPGSMGGGERVFEGENFLRSFVLPNAYFHVTTAFAILRHNGVPIGKFDYLLGDDAP